MKSIEIKLYIYTTCIETKKKMYNNNNVSIKKYNYYLYIVFYCVMTFTITINVTNAENKKLERLLDIDLNHWK